MVRVAGFEVMLELMSCCTGLDSSAPIAAYKDGQFWKVWTSAQASAALREFVAQQELNPQEYAPHTERIVSATHTAAMGLSPWAVQLQGTWISKAFQPHIRNNREDVEKMSVALTSDTMGNGVQPGRLTKWSRGSCKWAK